ncbi:MAG: DUF3662 domain-containing protein, partial [Candidatus Eremiobacteraeota bacterium]|nr:DUF3662 domain-containing protein [Candidatus Eremiobacteraeota bacterium]
ARKLVATMEANTQTEEKELYAPHAYDVRVSHDDYTKLVKHREYLEREWAALLIDMAKRVGITFASAPVVSLSEDWRVVSGSVDIVCDPDAEPAATAPRRYVLRMVKGVPPEAVFRLDERVTIGRSDQNDVVLNDPRVSRRHAAIEMEDTVPVLSDLKSTNGSFVDGRRVRRADLQVGDLMTFGDTTLRLEEA